MEFNEDCVKILVFLAVLVEIVVINPHLLCFADVVNQNLGHPHVITEKLPEFKPSHFGILACL
jgi:hypothetical protein